MSVDNCPKCGRSLIETDGYYRKDIIVQYIGLRSQHVMDDPETGGCGWAWTTSKDPRDQELADKWNSENYFVKEENIGD